MCQRSPRRRGCSYAAGGLSDMTVAQQPDTDDPAAVRAVLAAEYAIARRSARRAGWSASLVRTSLFLGVLSAVGVGLGFAAQAGGA